MGIKARPRIYMFLTVALEFFEKIIGEVLSDFIEKRWRTLPVSFSPRRKYYHALAAAIREMPFIYKDLDAEVLTDFVDIELTQIHAKGLILLDSSREREQLARRTNRDKYQRLKEFKKILLLGNPGMGKSTLMRHVVMSIIMKKETVYLTNIKGNVPIFIPLKAIDNTEPSPIVRYILAEIPYFAGTHGSNRFRQLLSSQKIFLLLDGYDELDQSYRHKFAQFEINLFLTSNISETQIPTNTVDPQFNEIYTLLSNCKIWVSTRDEYYRRVPLKNLDVQAWRDNYNTYERYFAPIKIVGLGETRATFAKNIFARYKEKAKLFQENLDANLFILTIDQSGDRELIELSETPLFLTIMCYIYAEQVKENQSPIDSWNGRIDDLVLRCIDTLMKDLDEYKVRGLSKSRTKMYQKMKNDYVDEKLEFLGFLALNLLTENKPLFDTDYLKIKANAFFSALSKSKNKANILDMINQPSPKYPGMLDQLIYSGIFSSANIVREKTEYDFPHRRFREVLAMSHIRNVDLDEILKLVTNPNISEFILFLYRRKPEFRVKIADACLDTCISKTNSQYGNTLLYELFESKGESEDSTLPSLIENRIRIWVNENTRFYFDEKLIEKITFSDSFRKWVDDRFWDHDVGKLNATTAILSLIAFTDPLGARSRYIGFFKTLYTDRLSLYCFLLAKHYFQWHSGFRQRKKQNVLGSNDLHTLQYLMKAPLENTDLNSKQKLTILLHSTLAAEMSRQHQKTILQDSAFLRALNPEEKAAILNERSLEKDLDQNWVLETLRQDETLNLIPTSRIKFIKDIDDSYRTWLILRQADLLLAYDQLQAQELTDQVRLTIYLGYFSIFGQPALVHRDVLHQLIYRRINLHDLSLIAFLRFVAPELHQRLLEIDADYKIHMQFIEWVTRDFSHKIPDKSTLERRLTKELVSLESYGLDISSPQYAQLNERRQFLRIVLSLSSKEYNDQFSAIAQTAQLDPDLLVPNIRNSAQFS